MRGPRRAKRRTPLSRRRPAGGKAVSVTASVTHLGREAKRRARIAAKTNAWRFRLQSVPGGILGIGKMAGLGRVSYGIEKKQGAQLAAVSWAAQRTPSSGLLIEKEPQRGID